MLGEKYHDEHDQFDHLHVSSRSVAFDEEYTLGQELGTGAMSVVRMAEHKHSGRRLAVKCIAKEPLNLDDEAALLQEVNILQKLDHPNIVKLHAFFDEPTMFYLVMDLIDGNVRNGAPNECARVAGSPPDTVADRTAPNRRRPRAGSRR